jgi:hypothetical protein
MPPEIPPDVILKSTIRPGSVYYFPHETFSSDAPHYFIVINKEPFTAPTILMVCSSTRFFKVQTRNANVPAQTLVRITPAQYPDFPYPSIIDCNRVYKESIEGLIQRLSNRTLQLKAEMNMTLVEQLRQGVLSSPQIAGNIKKLLLK